MAVIFGALGSISLSANDITEMSLEDLVEVEVEIASLFKESPLTVGSTVSRVDESSWNMMGARRTMDALDYLPGTQIVDNINGGQSIATRGFSLTPFMRGDAMFLDGIPLNSTVVSSSNLFASNVPLGLLESMEMIRGPGSSLYGSDAFHAVVSMKTWNPDKDIDQARVRYGSFTYNQVMARSSRALPGGWRLTVAGEQRHQNNAHVHHRYTDTRQLERDGRWQRDTRSSGGFAKIHNDKFKFMYLEHEIRNKQFPGVGTTLLFPAGNQMEGEGRFRTGQMTYHDALTGDLELEISGYYSDNRVDAVFGSNAGAPQTLFLQKFDTIRSGGDVRFKRPAVNSPVQWVAGYGYSYTKILDAQNKLDGISPFKEEMMRGEVTAVNSFYVNADVDLNDEETLKAVIGGRADFYSHYGSETSPRLGLIYHPQADAAIKLLYGKAFRAPSSVERKGSLVVEANRYIRPESIETYEVVFMKQTKKFHFTTTFYRSEIDNLVQFVPATPAGRLLGFTTRHGNSGAGVSRGVEQEVDYKHHRWTFNGSASHQVAKITRPSTNYFHSFPKWIGNLGAKFDKDENFSIQLRGRWMQGWREGNTAVTSHLKVYKRLDLGIRRRMPMWGESTWLEIDVKNLGARNNTQPSVVDLAGGIPDERIRATVGLYSEF